MASISAAALMVNTAWLSASKGWTKLGSEVSGVWEGAFMVYPRDQEILRGMGPSIFREKIAMMAGTAAKGPMSRDMTKELTNQKVSASLPVVPARTGGTPFFPLPSIFFMAGLLSRVSWAAQNHFMPRFACMHTQGACQGRGERLAGNGHEYFFYGKTTGYINIKN
jgi:hypothetical protein